MMMMRTAVSSVTERLEKLLLDNRSRESGKGYLSHIVRELMIKLRRMNKYLISVVFSALPSRMKILMIAD